MTSHEPRSTNRREFLVGNTLRSEAGVDESLSSEMSGDPLRPEPNAGDTLRLETRAMACEFAAILNPGDSEQIAAASDALELVHRLEDQISVYRDGSEVSRLNREAANAAVEVESELFALLDRSRQICVETDGGFDLTSGPLVTLWRRCRSDGRIPTEREVAETLALTGIEHVEFDEDDSTIRFSRDNVELNLGGIGKGYALDRAGAVLRERGVEDWLLHGGHSSLLARGDHNRLGGWPVGIRNPLFPRERLVTLLLKDCAMSTSGTGVQHFRLGGKRYGHILDPRTGWPVDSMLSVTVIAPTAAEADALSTAFFVLGLEKAVEYCHNHPGIGALLISPPHRSRKLEPVICGIPDEVLFFTPSLDDINSSQIDDG